jgi:DNA-binding MarR family transcriptional regulator
MRELLQKAIAEIEKLPAEEQDAVAARILADLTDEEGWSSRFNATTNEEWDSMAEMVRREIALGGSE